mmetsp:Transcript_29437/g.87005  ORF Transcript_29437/g.87005 Transcript_29437/m.87005 type:complete len:214 (-) Transcript_29437:2250-2891(-)
MRATCRALHRLSTTEHPSRLRTISSCIASCSVTSISLLVMCAPAVRRLGGGYTEASLGPVLPLPFASSLAFEPEPREALLGVAPRGASALVDCIRNGEDGRLLPLPLASVPEPRRAAAAAAFSCRAVDITCHLFRSAFAAEKPAGAHHGWPRPLSPPMGPPAPPPLYPCACAGSSRSTIKPSSSSVPAGLRSAAMLFSVMSAPRVLAIDGTAF